MGNVALELIKTLGATLIASGVAFFFGRLSKKADRADETEDALIGIRNELKRLNEKTDSDYEAIKDLNKKTEKVFRVVYQLLQHEVTGNHVTDVNQLLNELQRDIKF